MTTMYDPTPVLDALTRVTGKEIKGGPQYSATCPAHDDRSASLSFKAEPDKGKIFCHAGCGRLDILAALDLGFWALFPPRDDRDQPADRDPDGGTWMPCTHTKVASYRYHDADGALVFGVARCHLKGNGCQGFRQWRPDPTSKSGRKWSITLPDGSRVGEGLPYRLPEVLAELRKEWPAAGNIYVCEGEKDVDRLWSLGVPATCNAGGAGKWTPHHAQWLAGADVIIVADRDEPGWKHAEMVANSLIGLARSVEIVRAKTGKDISDHLAAGLKLVDLVSVAEPKQAPQTIPADGRDPYVTAGAQ